MPEPAAQSQAARPSVFLSYASEDRAAARLLRDALPDHGLEVWYDESELGGGDAWDQKIRRQIRDCDYFMPLISAQTERRHEGYFRREWRLAVERTLDMADDHLYLLPIVIDDTPQSGARVPERFLSVQWLKVPGGAQTPALEALCRRIASGAVAGGPRGAPRSAAGGPGFAGGASTSPGGGSTAAAGGSVPPGGAFISVDGEAASPGGPFTSAGGGSAPPGGPFTSAGGGSAPPGGGSAAPLAGASAGSMAFPLEVPGQKVRFWVEVAGWLLRSGWLQFKRLPRWVRIVAYAWLGIALLSRCDSSSRQHSDEIAPSKGSHTAAAPADTAPDDSDEDVPGGITPDKVARLKAIAKQYEGTHDTHDIAKLAGAIAREFGADTEDVAHSAGAHAGADSAAKPLLAIAFTASPGDAPGRRLANSVFAMAYGMIEISHQGHVGLTKEPLGAEGPDAAIARGKAAQAAYVLYGTVGPSVAGARGAADAHTDSGRTLTVTIAAVADDTVVWTHSYAVASADPSTIAADINAHLPAGAGLTAPAAGVGGAPSAPPVSPPDLRPAATR